MSAISSPQVRELLDALYADAATNDPLQREAAKDARAATTSSDLDFYRVMNKAYMAVSREFGNLLYALVRSTRAKTVVEFGTSFGLSTIFLAAALRDNGGGTVITTEFDEEKVARARANLTAAGLAEYVEFRVGDARETLRENVGEIDLIFLDGAKGLYLEVLKVLEPHLRRGGLIASDNTDHEGLEAFLAHIRDAEKGYTSAALLTDGDRGHEVTVKI